VIGEILPLAFLAHYGNATVAQSFAMKKPALERGFFF